MKPINKIVYWIEMQRLPNAGDEVIIRLFAQKAGGQRELLTEHFCLQTYTGILLHRGLISTQVRLDLNESSRPTGEGKPSEIVFYPRLGKLCQD